MSTQNHCQLKKWGEINMNRVFDLLLSLVGLILLSPIFLLVSFLIWKTDGHNPFYVSKRVGLLGKLFTFIKFRSMRKGADKTGVDSTSNNDQRITAIGQKVRRYKIDELPQLINVLFGTMSLVGPRPNVVREVALYTDEEQKLLQILPGVTSLSSIVFSDEGDILAQHSDPDIAYNQLIRPWKNRLDLFYVQHHSLSSSISVIFMTVVALFSREKALERVHQFLIKRNADTALIEVAARTKDLMPSPPPGATDIVTSRL